MRPSHTLLAVLIPAAFLSAGCPSDDKDDELDCSGLNPDPRCDTGPGETAETGETGETGETDTGPVETGETGETDTGPVETGETGETDTGPVETDTDPVETDTGPVDTDTGETGDTDIAYFDADDLLPTHLAITEMMITPAGCGAAPSGQYVELKSDADVDWFLVNLQLTIGTTNYVFNDPARRIGAKERFVLEPASAASCHPILDSGAVNSDGSFGPYGPNPADPYAASVVFPPVSAPNNQKFVRVSAFNAGTNFDQVNYGGWNFGGTGGQVTPEGYAMHLVEDQPSGTLLKVWNEDPANWCLGHIDLQNGNFGSPFGRATNRTSQCGVPPVDTGDSGPGDGCRSLEQADAGDLVITEVLFSAGQACTNPTSGQYIEVVNVSDECLDLSSLQLDWGTAPATTNRPILAASGSDFDLEPGEIALIRRRDAGFVCPSFNPTFTPEAVAADRFRFEFELGPANNLLRIKDGGGRVLDSVDFRAGFQAPPEASSLVYGYGGSVPDASDNNSAARWCTATDFVPGPQLFGRPGRLNDACPIDTDPPDTEDTGDTGEIPCFSRPRTTEDGLDATEVCPGELMITEIMTEPIACGVKSHCQYVELYNASPYDINPTGLLLRNNSTSSLNDLKWLNIPSSTQIPPGGYQIVVIESPQIVLQYRYAPYPPTLFLSTFGGTSAGAFAPGSFVLRNATDIIDRVNTTGWSVAGVPRRSMQLREIPNVESDNDAEAAWCLADLDSQRIPLHSELGQSGGDSVDAGTPGAENLCVGEEDTDGEEFARDVSDGLDANELEPGELVITEAMFQPLDCVGASARFIEVYNTTPYVVRPEGLEIRVGSASGTAVVEQAPGEIAPNSYAVLGLGTDDPFCYDANRSFQIDGLTRLSEAAIALRTPFFVIDAVNFASFQIPLGASLQLVPTVSPSATANDDESAWCPAGTRAPGAATSDRASPGFASQVCGSYEPGDIGVDSGGTVLTVADLQPGDVFVSELMLNPSCPRERAEYLEVLNRAGRTVDLQGLELVVNGSVPFVFPDELAIGPGERALLLRDPGSAGRCIVPLADGDVVYRGGMGFTNGSSRSVVLQVRRDGVPLEIHRVETAPLLGGLAGRATQLDPLRGAVGGTIRSSDWCSTLPLREFELEPLSGEGLFEYGTPGRSNHSCDDPGDSDFFDSDDSDPGEIGPIDTDPETPDVEWEPVSVLQPGDLVITEVMATPAACSPQTTAEYVEVYNRRSDRVNLFGLEIFDKNNSLARVDTRVLVEPGGYAVLANISSGLTNRCYLDPRSSEAIGGYRGGAQLNDAGDAIALYTPGGVLVTSFDFTELPRVFGRSYELGRLTDPTSSEAVNPARWCPATQPFAGTTDRGTPGAPNACDPSDTVPPRDGALGPGDLTAGDLVINEVFVESAVPGCSRFNSQYLEIRNVTSSVVDLRGVRLTNAAGEAAAVQILDQVLVGPGELVTGRRWSSEPCYPLSVDFQYPGVAFRREGDRFQVWADAGPVDVVDTAPWPVLPQGASMSLDRGVSDAVTNNDLQSWCPSVDMITLSGGFDRGTPTRENAFCPTAPSDTDQEDSGGPPGFDSDDDLPFDTDVVSDTDPVVALADLGPGDLQIEELMISSVDCADARAEYVEVRNLSGSAVDLAGLTLQSDGGSAQVQSTVLVPAGGRVLGVRLDATPQCHGLPADFVYSGVSFSNAGDTVVIRDGATVFDTVAYASQEVTSGRSWSRDAAGRWCPTLSRIPGGLADHGTPRFANPDCEGDLDTGFADTFDTFSFDPDLDLVSVEQAEVGELIITEFLVDSRDCAAAAAQYIEIYNNSDRSFDLDGLAVGNGLTTFTFDRPPGRFVIAPGQYRLLRRTSTQPCYDIGEHGRFSNVPLGPNSGRVLLANATTVIDLVDFRSFTLRGGRAFTLNPDRLGVSGPGGVADPPGSTSFSGTYTHNSVDHWCSAWERIPGAVADKGSPGVANTACLEETGEVPFPPDYVAAIGELDPGDLVITELMIDPSDCGDLFGEYIEIKNVFPTTVDLQGMLVSTTTATATVRESVLVEPGAYVVGRKTAVLDVRGDQSGAFFCYPGLSPDFLFPGVSFRDGGERVRIGSTSVILDEVDYRPWGGAFEGRSLQLLAGFEDADSNNVQENWCFSDDVFVGAVNDRGSPRRQAETCFATPAIRTLDDLDEGDLIVSEVLVRGIGCPTNSSYMGLFNTTSDALQLQGLRLEVRSGSRFIDRSLVLLPGEEALIAANPGDCFDYPREPDVAFRAGSTGFWSVSNDDVIRLTANGRDIDVLDMTQFPSVVDGVSWQLQPGMESGSANNDFSNWCLSEVYFNASGHRGTPGLPNDCGPDTDGPPDPLVDTSEDPFEISDTAAYFITFSEGFGEFSKGSFFEGWMQRMSTLRRRPQLALPSPSDFEPDCYYEWTLGLLGTVPTDDLCPSCEFGFHLRARNRVDFMAQFLSRPSSCPGAFDEVGGSGSSVDLGRLIYSQSYGLMMREVGGQLEPYTYQVTSPGDSNVKWLRVLYFESYGGAAP